MDKWTPKTLDASQTAMFDVLMGEIVPSLKACDAPTEDYEKADDDG